MHVLRDNRLTIHTPTQTTNIEELIVGHTRIRAFDLGGHNAARRIWRNYYVDVSGVVFLVDSVDRERFSEVKHELHRVLKDEVLVGVPVLVLGNKIDVPGAASEDELVAALDLYQLTTGKGEHVVNDSRRPVEVFMISVARRMGYEEGFSWLCNRIS